MPNDPIESLLSRHYGSTAPVPVKLEERLHASLRQEVSELREQQRVTERLRQQRFSRRRLLKLVTLGTAGLGVVSLGMEGLRAVEAALTGQDVTRPAYQ